MLVNDSVRVWVRFFTTLREVTGKKEETLKLSRREAVTDQPCALERFVGYTEKALLNTFTTTKPARSEVFCSS